jgi:hypothetical protein
LVIATICGVFTAHGATVLTVMPSRARHTGGQTMDAALGGIVGGMIPKSVADRVGAEIDDPAVGIGAHLRDRMPGAPQHRPQITVDGGAQCLRRMFGESLDNAAAGIVDQHIEPTKMIDRESIVPLATLSDDRSPA